MATQGTTAREGLAAEVCATVDAAAGERVIVLGSLPPAGRDLDLVARSPERQRIERALDLAGLVRKGSSHALFRACTAYGVELFDAHRVFPADAVEGLFTQSLPLDGFRTLARPAPAHALLILARLVSEEGSLRPKRRARLERILAEDPEAWAKARQSAGAWRAARDLALLERAAAGARRPLLARVRAPAPQALLSAHRRRVLVALSGIDGAGKSSQARWLADALTALGVEVEVVWNDLLGNRALDVAAAPVKALLRLMKREASESMARFEEQPASGPEPSASFARAVWSMIVTLANALEQRMVVVRSIKSRGVTVFDRSPLDLAVRMQVIYRSNVKPQHVLVRLAAPRPDLAFLLDIPAEVSLVRKDDIWSVSQLREQATLYRTLAPRFGVRRLDGQRAPEEIAADIARETWLALR